MEPDDDPPGLDHDAVQAAQFSTALPFARGNYQAQPPQVAMGIPQPQSPQVAMGNPQFQSPQVAMGSPPGSVGEAKEAIHPSGDLGTASPLSEVMWRRSAFIANSFAACSTKAIARKRLVALDLTHAISRKRTAQGKLKQCEMEVADALAAENRLREVQVSKAAELESHRLKATESSSKLLENAIALSRDHASFLVMVPTLLAEDQRCMVKSALDHYASVGEFGHVSSRERGGTCKRRSSS